MSVITENGTGYTERDLVHNWAAEYAKRLCGRLEEKLEDANREVLENAKQYSDSSLDAAKAYAVSGDNDTLAAAKAYADRDNAVSTNQLADGSVTKKKLADGAVTEEKLADVSVTNDKLGARSVTTGKILDKCITAAKLAEPSVTTEKLADGAVTAEKLSTSGVTNEKIKTGAVDARAIADGSITLSELSDALQSRLIIGCDNCGETSAIPHESGVYQWLGGTIQVTEDNTNNTTQTITTPGGIVLVSDCDGDIIEILFCGERDSYDSLEYAHPMQIYWRSLIHDYDTQDPVSYDPVPWMLVNSTWKQHTQTLQRSGTWTDGTPIWRTAVGMTLSADDFTKGFYQLTAADLQVVLRDMISLILTDSLRCCSPINDAEDSVPVRIGDGMKIDLSGVPSAYKVLAGYIEFVTPESNLA